MLILGYSTVTSLTPFINFRNFVIDSKIRVNTKLNASFVLHVISKAYKIYEYITHIVPDR